MLKKCLVLLERMPQTRARFEWVAGEAARMTCAMALRRLGVQFPLRLFWPYTPTRGAPAAVLRADVVTVQKCVLVIVDWISTVPAGATTAPSDDYAKVMDSLCNDAIVVPIVGQLRTADARQRHEVLQACMLLSYLARTVTDGWDCYRHPCWWGPQYILCQCVHKLTGLCNNGN